MYMCTYAEIETKSVGNTYRYFLNFGIEYAKVKRGRNDTKLVLRDLRFTISWALCFYLDFFKNQFFTDDTTVEL